MKINLKEIRQRTIDLSYTLYVLIQSIGTVGGILAWSLLDVALGGILYSLVFKDVDILILGRVSLGHILGWSLSISLWFIQMTVWRYLEENGKLNWKNGRIVLALAIGIILAILDTLGDSSPILIFVNSSEIITQANGIPFLGTSLGKVLSNSILWITILLTGLGEPLNTLIFRNASKEISLGASRTTKSKPHVQPINPPMSGFPFPTAGRGRKP